MIRLLLLFSTLSLIPNYVWCQSGTDGTEEATFVQIYMQSKSSTSSSELGIQPLMHDHKITPQRYKELAQQAAMGDRLQLSKAEKNFVDAVANFDDLRRERKAAVIDSLCQSFGMPSETYTQLLNSYKTSTKYQRILQPYFQAYIKAQK